jgi:serine protease AprX
MIDTIIDLINNEKNSLSKISPQTKENTEKILIALEEIKDSPGEVCQSMSPIAHLLDENLIAIENISTVHVHSDDKSDELLEFRNKAERMWRLTVLLSPTDPEFEPTLWWAAEKGGEIELDTLHYIQNCINANDFNVSQRVKSQIIRSIEKIKQRIQSRATYKVFVSEQDLRRVWGTLSMEVVHSSYPAYTILTASEETIAQIKKSFPIERLESQPSQGESIMTDGRDWVVYFHTPVTDKCRQIIEEVDSRIHVWQPLGRFQLVISSPSKEITSQISKLEEVAQVIPFEPKIRVRTEYLEKLGQEVTEVTEEAEEAIAAALAAFSNRQKNSPNSHDRNMPIPGILIADFFSEEDQRAAIKDLESREIRIASKPRLTTLILDLSANKNSIDAFEFIKKQIGLRTLEEKTIDTPFNNKARTVIGKNVVPPNPTPNPNSLSLTGKGEIIAISDTGLDTGDKETLHLDIRGRVKTIQSYPIQPEYDSSVKNPGYDDGSADRYSGHGTHIAGSALGNGQQAINLSILPIKGMAPEAELFFQAIEQVPKWNFTYIMSYIEEFGVDPRDKPQLCGRPQKIELLFQEAYQEGARIHSLSWGDGNLSDYDTDRCHALDEFVWNHKKFLAVVSAGNKGKQTSSENQYIDPQSLPCPATAKNCLTVGACENDRLGEFDDTYAVFSANNFSDEPFGSDCMVDSLDDIAAFSGRGPCLDGRRKPDVIAPGTFILSTRSSQIGDNVEWGAYPPAQDYYMYNGGSSMATPLVAGCAALVRQYLREQYQQPISDPNAALVKAAIIHSAQYHQYRYAHPSSRPWADNEQGWGRVDLQQVLNPKAPIKVIFIDIEEANGLVTGEKHTHQVKITDSSVPLRVTLVYTDRPEENLIDIDPVGILINNLNLVVYSPSGEYYLGNDFRKTGNPDTINNVEGVVAESPETGEWRIEIVAELREGLQDYAVVISGGGAEIIS